MIIGISTLIWIMLDCIHDFTYVALSKDLVVIDYITENIFYHV